MINAVAATILRMTDRGDGRSFTPAQNEKLREMAAKALAERFGGNRAAMAKALGLSGPALSNFLNHVTGAGTKLAGALARELGMSLPEIIGAASGDATPGASRPVYGNLEGWGAGAAQLLELGLVVPEEIADAAQMSGLRTPEPVTIEFVLQACLFARRFASPAIKAAADAETEKFRRKNQRERERFASPTKK